MNTTHYLPHQEHITDSELTLYSDRLLSDEECQLIEEHCEHCESCEKARVHSLKIHLLFETAYPNPILSEQRYEAAKVRNWNTISAELQRMVKEEQKSQSAQERLENSLDHFTSLFKRRFGSVMVMAMVTTAIFLSTTGFKSTLVDFVVSSHEREWPSEVHSSEINKVQSWFAKHAEAGVALQVPEFTQQKTPFQLEKARLSLAQVAPERWERTAHLIYRLKDGNQRITVLAFRGKPDAIDEGEEHQVSGVGVRLIKRGPLHVAHYSRGDLSYILTSGLKKQELLKLIKADISR